MDKPAPIAMHRELLTIEGGRNLYNYTFTHATPQDRLMQMIEGRQEGVIGAFVERHREDLDLEAARNLAARLGNTEAAEALDAD